MIVNPSENGWEVIFHRSHALLAANIALHWHNKDRIEKVAETIAAIAQHDDLEREFEGDHLTPAGAPMDFTQRPKDPKIELPRWQEMLTNALYRSRWVAVLSAMHICFLTAEMRGASPELDQFLAETERQLTRWRQELDIGKREASAAYAFFQWCDRLSLILAQNELPAMERWLEISPGPDGTSYDIRQRQADGTLEVRPWPFRENEFTVEADTRVLKQLKFDSNAELVDALQQAKIGCRTWTFRRV